jgi:RNA polymerase sigma-70 factor, ECF subfamily
MRRLDLPALREGRRTLQRPPGQRQILLLSDVEGRPAAEVCHVLALSETNQWVLLHRARAKARRALDGYYRGEGRA